MPGSFLLPAVWAEALAAYKLKTLNLLHPLAPTPHQGLEACVWWMRRMPTGEGATLRTLPLCLLLRGGWSEGERQGPPSRPGAAAGGSEPLSLASGWLSEALRTIEPQEQLQGRRGSQP